MARSGTVGAAVPTTTVARPPFWLAALVVTIGMAHSGGFTEVKPCLLRCPSKMDCYYGKNTVRGKGI